MVKNLLRIFGLCCAGLAVSTGVGAQEHTVESASNGSVLAVVPSEHEEGLGPMAMILHDYGPALLVRFQGKVPTDLANDIHPLPKGDTVSFRGWSGPVGSIDSASDLASGRVLISLIGPLDNQWREAFEGAGLEIVAPAHPHALVVSADAMSLELAMHIVTTKGVPVIRGIQRLPVEARVHRSLVPVLTGERSGIDLELSIFEDRPGGGVAKGVRVRPSSVRLSGGDLLRLLEEHPEIAYVEPVFFPETHNNLAARPELISVEPVWDLGYNGSGVVVSHNDTGVDLKPTGVIHGKLVKNILA